ncbi:MAG TPA: HEPN domain-containing protein [Thermodesulfobacteriota bacterium]|nr:HEPN domain-containing protein [Thermodesulfobacteriota bacterium]
MTNFELGIKLIEEAGEYLDEVKRAYKKGSWNIVVRRAQEVVELSLKGLLKVMGAEYPKVHDPAEFFISILERRQVELNEKAKEKLKRYLLI